MIQCQNCSRQFLYPATKRYFEEFTVKGSTDVLSLTSLTVPRFETRNCPYCQSPNLIEVPEAKEFEGVTSVLDVSLCDVDDKLKEGYVVHALYSKNAVLIKKANGEGKP